MAQRRQLGGQIRNHRAGVQIDIEGEPKATWSHGFEVFTHQRVPPNDSGIALGQAAVANALIKAGSIH